MRKVSSDEYIQNRDILRSEVAMKKSTQSTNPEPSHDEISARAQQIYEEQGCPCGKAEEHWREAECQLREAKASDAEMGVVGAPAPTKPVAGA